MITRTITALVGIAIAVVLVFWPGGLPFAIAIGLISVGGVMEFYRGVRRIGVRPVEWAGILATILFVTSMRTYERVTIGSVFPATLTLLLILSFLVELIRKKRAPLVNVGVTVFGAIYVGWLISHLVVLRELHGDVTVYGYTNTVGAWLVMYTFVCTWACDTGAYFIGRYYGRTRIAAKLSPNKTLEGAVGGLVCAVLIAAIAGLVIKLPPQHALALGVIFGVASQLGDFSESAIKRELTVKDFGTVVPGHGGILDRFDSLLFTGPLAYYYILRFLAHWPG
jgi:phosphatidate cytidylyltransferase